MGTRKDIMRGYLHENLFLSHASRSESPNFESVGLFLVVIVISEFTVFLKISLDNIKIFN